MKDKKPDTSSSSEASESRWYQGRGAAPLGLVLLGGAAAGLYAFSKEAPAEPRSLDIAAPDRDSRLEGLGESANEILSRISDQESSRDATCWSSVRMIEGFSLGRQLTPSAEIARIEVSRALLGRLWQQASKGTPESVLGAKDITASLPSPVTKAIDDLEVAAARTPGSAPAGQAAQGMYDQQKTTENWRAILSLVLTEALEPQGLRRLDPGGAEVLAKASTAMTGLVLQEAASFAEKRKHEKVILDDVQEGYRTLVSGWFPDGKTKPLRTEDTDKGIAADAFKVTRQSTMKNATGKLAALAQYNKLKKAPAFQAAGDLAPYLSKVVGFEIAPDGAMKLAEELRTFARLFLAHEGPLRSDTFSNSLTGLGEDKTDGPRRYITLAHVFNATQDLFPTRKLANADAEVLMTRNVIPGPGQPSVIDERRVTLEAPSLDAVRDTGIHWLALRAALKEEENVALDPFAAELLSETLSEYAFFLLQGAVKGAVAMKQSAVSGAVIDRLPWKYPLGRFFPVEDPESSPVDPIDAPAPAVIPSFIERPVPESVGREAGARCTAVRRGFQAFMGSGIGIGDYDGDGRSDIFLAADGCNRLLHNEGRFALKDVTADAGLYGIAHSSRHPVFADINGDGALDLLVTQSDEKSLLYIQKDGHFQSASSKWGLVTGRGAHSATFFDFDQDGDLDLFVGRYGPSKGDAAVPTLDGRNGYPNQLFRNDDGKKFTDISEESGLASTAWTLASAAVDVDSDGRLDLWLANDFGRDQVFLNLGGGKFRDIGHELGTDDRGSGMNVSVFEINGDEQPDIFVSMIEMFSKTLRFILPHGQSAYEVDDRVLSSSYYISGMKLFTSGAAPNNRSSLPFAFADGSGTHIDTQRKGWAWGAVPFDYDRDGDLDLYLANGWIQKSAFFEQYNQLMLNEDGRLTSYGPPATLTKGSTTEPARTPSSTLTFAGSSRAVAAADLDGDGDEDILVVDYQGGLRLFENTTQTRGTSLRIKLEGKGLNRNGIGATVKVFINDGPPLVRYASAGGDYLAQTDTPLFFGLPADAKLKKVVVRWASGKESVLGSPQPKDNTIAISEP